MNIPLSVTDNITELLVKIIEFTRSRQKVLVMNINNVYNPGFVPKDLAVDEFSELLSDAIDEHARSQRLLLRDTKSIKFGTAGAFEIEPEVDESARVLFENNPDEYLELQINKLLENSLNQRVAAELLRGKQEDIFDF